MVCPLLLSFLGQNPEPKFEKKHTLYIIFTLRIYLWGNCLRYKNESYYIIHVYKK